ncbi:hypothetical protein PGT21_006955 [Puccinia graminis f. sp. tritici]|uniref:Uncharacterized protein n=1 Tax=Puccinia graminis f. sp. tritici TaxID=56615 RepID=A0A5B0PRA8_PUCGR|nr:hypothetical protein PGTUg99_000090 [Puccinia graminis f. sp. tritici]KAA1103120.1 hypothetical protein PGT21_006955 [Puccinia graminis f. sp. tritici]
MVDLKNHEAVLPVSFGLPEWCNLLGWEATPRTTSGEARIGRCCHDAHRSHRIRVYARIYD